MQRVWGVCLLFKLRASQKVGRHLKVMLVPYMVKMGCFCDFLLKVSKKRGVRLLYHYQLAVRFKCYVDFLLSAYRHQGTEVSFLKTPWKRLAISVYLLDNRPFFMFPLYLGVHTFHHTRSKFIARPILVLNSTERFIILLARYKYVAISYLLWT